MGLYDWFAQGGQARREWLDDTVGGLFSDGSYRTTHPRFQPSGPVAEPLSVRTLRDYGEWLPGYGDAVDAANAVEAFGDNRYLTGGLLAGAATIGLVPGVGDALAKPIKWGAHKVDDGFRWVADDLGRYWADEAGSIPAGRINPAAQRGDEVLGLLSSGRASEVTDEMLDMGDPVLNTRLNEYLFNNYDLPMDYESRAARADQHWPDDAYHATGAEFQQFIPSQVGRHGAGVYTGKNASDVQTFLPKDEETRRYAEGSQVLPLRIPDDAQMASEMKWQDALPERWNYGDPKDVTDAISGYAEAADALSQSGFKGVAQPATDWDGRVIFDPSNIRSRFARFDPRLSHLRNLNASVPTWTIPLYSAGLGGLGLLASEEQQ